MKRALKYIRRALLAIVVLVVVAVAFIHTPWGKSFVRGRIEKKLAAPFEGRASIGDLDYGFMFGSVELSNVVILDRAGRPAISVGSIRADIDRGSVLHGTPVIDSLAIDGLDLAIIEDAKGVSNLVGIATPSKEKRDPLASITVRTVEVHGKAAITKADGTQLDVTDIAVAGSLSARPKDKEANLELSALSAKLHVARPNVPARDLELSVAGATLAKHDKAIDAKIQGIVLGAASIEALTGHINIVDGVPTGEQSVAVTKLKIDRSKLHTMLGRELLVADIGVDATLAGPANALLVHGAVSSRATTLALDGTVDASNQLRPRYDLKLVGTGKSSDLISPALRPQRPLPEIATRIEIGLVGAGIYLADLEAAITLDIGATTIGNVAVDGLHAKALAKNGGVTLETFRAKGLGFELAATGTMATDTTLHGTLTVTGNPADAMRVLTDAGIELPKRLDKIPRVGRVSLAVTAEGKLRGDLTVSLAPTRIAIAGGTIDAQGTATLTNKRVTTATTKVAIHGLDLAAAGRLAGRRLPRGRLSGTVELEKSPSGRTTAFDVTLALREPSIVVHAKGRTDPTHASIDARVTGVDRSSVATISAELPLDAGGLVPTRSWHVIIDAPERPTAELLALAPAKIRAKLPLEKLPATVALHGDLTGSPSAPRGTITARFTGPQSGQLRAVIAPDGQRLAIHTTGDLNVVDARDGRSLAAAISGSLSIPRLRFVNRRPAIAKPLDLRIDETITVAERPLAELPRVSPKLAALGGQAGGTVHVTGSPQALAIDANLAWRGYRVASGGTADTTLAITGSPTNLNVTITHANEVALTAAITRSPERMDIVATAKADAPLLSVLPALPAFAAMSTPGLDVGSLRWDMHASIGVRTQGKREIDRAEVTGSLAIRDASFALPHTNRRWDGIDLELSGAPDGVRLDLEAHEKDRDPIERTLKASGLLAIAKPTFRPTSLALTLTTKNWLVLGLTPPGLSDAPTGTLDLQATIAADLTQAIKTIEVTVDELALRAPDRHDRAHWPERISVAGDVIFLDEDQRAGALPVMPPKRPTMASATAPSIDVNIRIPKPVHIHRTLLNVYAHGDIALRIRPNQPIAPVGTLVLDSGSLLLFGAEHPLVDGTIHLSADYPTGLLDLRFERPLSDATMRDRADHTAGSRLTLGGAPTKPTVKLSGAANATLAEVFALYNAGRSVYAPRPTTYASASVQTPRGDQINILVFVSLALPHLLVLDRASAWSDTSEPRGAYGRIRNLELDRYTQGDSNRFRIIGRPNAPGRSTSELQLEHLFIHDRERAFGIGLRAGDRLGGGLGLTFDWSSD